MAARWLDFQFSRRVSSSQSTSIPGKTLWQGPGRAGERCHPQPWRFGRARALTNEGALIVLPVIAKEYAPSVQYTVASSQTWAHPVVIGNRILIKDETTLSSLRAQ